jgi:hypothetical protein
MTKEMAALALKQRVARPPKRNCLLKKREDGYDEQAARGEAGVGRPPPRPPGVRPPPPPRAGPPPLPRRLHRLAIH